MQTTANQKLRKNVKTESQGRAGQVSDWVVHLKLRETARVATFLQLLFFRIYSDRDLDVLPCRDALECSNSKMEHIQNQNELNSI
jgi:hypothetical protein